MNRGNYGIALVKNFSVTYVVNEENVAFLNKLAESLSRDRSYLIRQAVGDFIALHKWQLEDIDRAIGEADRGECGSDEDVQAMSQNCANEGALAHRRGTPLYRD